MAQGLPNELNGLRSVVSFPSEIQGKASAGNGFDCFPSDADCLSFRYLSYRMCHPIVTIILQILTDFQNFLLP